VTPSFCQTTSSLAIELSSSPVSTSDVTWDHATQSITVNIPSSLVLAGGAGSAGRTYDVTLTYVVQNYNGATEQSSQLSGTLQIVNPCTQATYADLTAPVGGLDNYSHVVSSPTPTTTTAHNQFTITGSATSAVDCGSINYVVKD